MVPTLNAVLDAVERTPLARGHAKLAELERRAERLEAQRGIVPTETIHPLDTGSQMALFEQRAEALNRRMRWLEA